jgi:1-acyl-sn-glycerol-3-phosphate acyltransferase
MRFRERLGHAGSLLILVPLFVLYTAVLGTISVASSLIDSRGGIQHTCARIWARMILWTCRIKVRVNGLERLTPGTAYVLCCNHQSHMDTPIILAALPFQFRFTPKKQLFRYPFLGWHLRRSGHVPIDRENPHAAVKSLKEAADTIRYGTPVVIFPEGGTSPDGAIRPFKGGGFMLAARAGAAVVPVTIRGSRAVLLPKTLYARPGIVEVVVGEPTPTAGVPTGELSSQVRRQIVETFNHGKTLDRNTYSISREV